MKRPLPVTILGWLFIVTGLVGLVYHLSDGPLDCWVVLDLPRSDNRCRRRSLLAHGSRLGSLADARVARLSRCRERVSLAVAIFRTCRAVDDRRLFPAGAACFQIFSVRAIRVRRP